MSTSAIASLPKPKRRRSKPRPQKAVSATGQHPKRRRRQRVTLGPIAPADAAQLLDSLAEAAFAAASRDDTAEYDELLQRMRSVEDRVAMGVARTAAVEELRNELLSDLDFFVDIDSCAAGFEA